MGVLSLLLCFPLCLGLYALDAPIDHLLHLRIAHNFAESEEQLPPHKLVAQHTVHVKL